MIVVKAIRIYSLVRLDVSECQTHCSGIFFFVFWNILVIADSEYSVHGF